MPIVTWWPCCRRTVILTSVPIQIVSPVRLVSMSMCHPLFSRLSAECVIHVKVHNNPC